MASHLHWIPAALLLAGLAGCAHAPSRSKDTAGSAGIDYSEDAIERRVESQARYSAAVLHDLNDDPAAAAEELFKAAMADPANESLVLEAAGRLLRQKKADRAVELLTRATARADAAGVLHARLALAYSVQGKKELAIEANRKAIKKSPRELAGYQYLAQLYLQHKQTDEGLKVLDEAARVEGTDAPFLVELGETYASFLRSQPADAVKDRCRTAFRRAAALDPGHPVLIQRIADGFHFLGELDSAVQFYLKLLQKYPDLPGVRDRLVEIYLRQENHEQAARQLEEVLRAAPTNPQGYFLLGSIYFEERKFKEAAEQYRKALLLNPAFETVYYDLAAAQLNLNQPREALATLDKARDQGFERRFAAELYTAMAHTRLKDYTNALRHLTAAEVIARTTETNRLTHAFYFQLGSANERLQRFEEAEKYFRQCLKMAPDFAEALNYLGYMWAERGENLDEAKRFIERAVQIEPKNAAYLDSLGWVYFKLNQPQEALRWLLKAVEHVEEPDPTLLDHLGDIYSALDKPDKAREAWQKSIDLEANESIRKKLEYPGHRPATDERRP
jgi:tetratricopeptide (TPR) repeat protein